MSFFSLNRERIRYNNINYTNRENANGVIFAA